MTGFIFYRGPSMLDGSPIVAIATGVDARGSRNGKTGADLIQTWIIRDDVSPIEATRTGADAAICGACPHRGTAQGPGKPVKGRSCYVNLAFGPSSVWRMLQGGGYPEIEASEAATLIGGRGVRLGAYGDPAAVPLHVWEALLTHAPYRTGYTHQWARFPELAPLVMASCDSSADRAAAGMLGFRTFRVRAEGEAVERREVVCPASEEAGRKTTCSDCRACGGTGAKAKADITIKAHGTVGMVRAFAARINPISV